MAVRKKVDQQAGITLVEMMVVLVIIGLVGSIVAVAVIPQLTKAQKDIDYSQIDGFHDAISLHKIHTGKYPSSLDDLVQNSGGSGWAGPYMDEIPTDPWNNEYLYLYPATGGTKPYEIRSLGADGVEGGVDDSMDISSHDKRK